MFGFVFFWKTGTQSMSHSSNAVFCPFEDSEEEALDAIALLRQ